MKKNRFITPEIEQNIVHMINVIVARTGDITWGTIAENTGYTRAALSRNSKIKAAYDASKSDTRKITSDSEDLEFLKAENKKLKTKLEKAKKIIEEYDSKYLNWIYNAQASALTPEMLNKPIPESMKTLQRRKGLK